MIFKHHFGSPPPDAADRIGSDFTALWPVLEKTKVPVLLVRASQGYLPDEVVAEFRERVPAATVTDIAARHNVQEHRPAELAGLIKAFARSTNV